MGNITQLKQGSLNGLRRQTNECIDNAYRKGYEDGEHEVNNTMLVKERQDGYNNGYEQGIADYRKFEKFFNSDGIVMFDDIRNTDGTLSLEMILQYLPMSEIMARIKAYEEKKKAEEESIKVGDEVLYGSSKLLVTKITNASICTVNPDGKVDTWRGTAELIKTGRHFDEVEQLLAKLRGEE